MNNTSKQIKIWKAGILWVFAALLIMAALVPLFSLIWRDRTQKHTKDECNLLADAVLKQSVVEEKGIRKSKHFLASYLSALNAMAGWAYAYGGTNEKETSLIYESVEYIPDGTAVLRGEDYKVLSGKFPRKEFDEAFEKREKSLSFGKGVMYLSSEFPGAGVTVISRMTPVPDIRDKGDSTPDLKTLKDSLLSNSDISMAMVRLSDRTVVGVSGKPGIREGDKLDEKPDQKGNLMIGNVRYIGGISENSLYRVYALVPSSAIFSKTVVSPFLPAGIFALLLLLTWLYAWFLRIDILRGRVEHGSKASDPEKFSSVVIRHVRLVFYLMAGCAIVFIILVCALCAVDNSRVRGNEILSDAEQYFKLDGRNAEALASYREEYRVLTLEKLRTLAENSPERMTDEALSDLGAAIGKDVFVIDKKGKVLASSKQEYDFSGMSDPQSDLYGFTSVLEGKADNKEITVSDGEEMSHLFWAVRCKKIDGMLITMDTFSVAITVSDYYADYKVPAGLALFASDLTTGEILSSSDAAFHGKSAGSVGLKGAVLEDGFVGETMLNGRRCLVQTNVNGNRAVTIASDIIYLIETYLPIIFATIVVGLLSISLMSLAIYYLQRNIWTDMTPAVQAPEKMTVQNKRKENEEKEKNENEEHEEDTAVFYLEKDGILHPERGAVGRWLEVKTPFRKQSADDKFRTVRHYLYIILLIMGSFFYQQRSRSGLSGSTTAYLLQRQWRYGLNIYALVYALLLVFVIYIIGVGLRRLVLFVGSNLGNRGETVARLFGSFIAYASAIGAIAYALIFIGVDTGMILASAGIVGLGISIGAKDMISDILAGIAIVFEGEFRTGDIVEINGYRGTVEEIGIRTTKVMSMENVKVFRNSEISGVINMTQRYSYAQVRIDISRAESLAKVETIFRKEFRRMRKKIPQIIAGIELCGIDQLNTDSLVLLFQAKCRESDRIRVERSLRREFDLIMEREHITP